MHQRDILNLLDILLHHDRTKRDLFGIGRDYDILERGKFNAVKARIARLYKDD